MPRPPFTHDAVVAVDSAAASPVRPGEQDHAARLGGS